MKLHKRHTGLTVFLVCLLFAAGCSEEEANQPSAAPEVSSIASMPPTPVPTAEPSASQTAAPTAAPSPSVLPSPSLLPSADAQTPSPQATVKPDPNQGEANRKALSWYYMKKKDGQVPDFPGDVKQLQPHQKAVWVGEGKKVYLTFDAGGSMEQSDKLLEILQENEVKVTFFLVGYNVKQHQEFVKKVAEDGHLIGNHTMTHKDMTELSDEAVKKELEEFAALAEEITGQPIAPMFRFPYGKYSLHLLDLVSEMGYTSVFWSTAMRDWEPRAGGAEDAYNDIMNGLHEGNIILMHVGSEENIEALDRIIKDVKAAGYEFASLEELVQ